MCTFTGQIRTFTFIQHTQSRNSYGKTIAVKCRFNSPNPNSEFDVANNAEPFFLELHSRTSHRSIKYYAIRNHTRDGQYLKCITMDIHSAVLLVHCFVCDVKNPWGMLRKCTNYNNKLFFVSSTSLDLQFGKHK